MGKVLQRRGGQREADRLLASFETFLNRDTCAGRQIHSQNSGCELESPSQEEDTQIDECPRTAVPSHRHRHVVLKHTRDNNTQLLSVWDEPHLSVKVVFCFFFTTNKANEKHPLERRKPWTDTSLLKPSPRPRRRGQTPRW